MNLKECFWYMFVKVGCFCLLYSSFILVFFYLNKCKNYKKGIMDLNL